jgi:hypothetical protein
MYQHFKKFMNTVRVDEPDPRFGNMLLEQFGGANAGHAPLYRMGLPRTRPGWPVKCLINRDLAG